MPLTTETTEDCQGIVHHASGIVTGDELVDASQAALRLVQNTQNFNYCYVDFSGATGLHARDEHLDQITHQDYLHAAYRPNAVVVIIAPRDEFYQLGKKWEQRVKDLNWTTYVTRDHDDGVVWLQKNFPRPPKAKAEKSSETA